MRPLPSSPCCWCSSWTAPRPGWSRGPGGGPRARRECPRRPPSATPGRRRRWSVSPVRRQLLQALSIVALLAAWELAVRAGWADQLFVPAPSAVMRAFRTIGPEAVGLLGETLGKTLVAYLLAVGLGVGAGLLIGGVRYLHDVLNPFLVALYALPKILVLPWILLAFGLAATPAVVYGVLQGFFPICLLVAGGVRDVDRMPLRV